ncbi:ExeM/NucH family extracellular endonuclease [Marinicella sp. S1101]|uniref:ExeM/NucH family extracellular endonuclease n=1 Tax=Marinicella marina TaxID=2996016 RepID=UPI002260CAB2|nr:ExeM/NucH family extracellular endonuclease [Marinicella marina]MCX7553671.1 ExeM/NucH family extracellular endonuclease [Marinicella marina]MDJ1140761.1 ExeM/NucH family extracellular endonuclease [Marinicella marina]
MSFAKTDCSQPTTPINVIQGNGQNSTFIQQKVWVKGIVTGDFRGKDRLGGYFIQNLTPDQNQQTSEGLFIQENNRQIPFQVGDVVITHGEVIEQFGVTQLKHAQRTRVCAKQQMLPNAVAIELPLEKGDLEHLEGMRVTLAKPQVITDNYQMAALGELVVSSEILMNPTSVVLPGESVEEVVAKNRLNRLIIDDGSMLKYAFAQSSESHSALPLDGANPIKLGQQVMTTGVMHYAFGQYKLQPTEPLVFSNSLISSKTMPPKVGGELKIAAFNVENFFTSIDDGTEKCGPAKNFGCRGADNKAEYQRQLAKLVHVINTADAAVVGLQELENNDSKSIKALTQALNTSAGFNQWSFIDTGALGGDVIKVGLIYQNNKVQPQGSHALLNKDSEPEFLERRNRIIVAQTFNAGSDNLFNVATVHFKSKSCRDAEGLNMNQNDGQSCYNPVRTQVAEQLARWLDTDPTKQGAAATFVVGDFNSYQLEDPMRKLKVMGYLNLADDFLGKNNWTSSYRGQVGSLDYILANEAGKKLITGLTQWHINSVSVDEYGYNNEPLDKGIERPESLFQINPYSSSDHDVVLAGISFDSKQ